MEPTEAAARWEALEGLVERVTYHNPENGYTVAKLAVSATSEPVTAVGHFGQLSAGESLRLLGRWGHHPKHGAQFVVASYETLQPASLTGLEKYLGSGLIKGVGPVTAKRMVKHFGLETLEVIAGYPDRLAEVPGVGAKRAGLITRAWQAQQHIQAVMVFLQAHGVSTTHAVKIFKAYGDQAIDVVSHNPYRLAEDIWGIGFKTADAIAQKLGVDPGSPGRLRAGLVHVIQEAADQGHVYYPMVDTLGAACELLGVPEAAASAALEALVASQGLFAEPIGASDQAIYAPALFHAERAAAGRLARLVQKPAEVPDGLPLELAALESEEALELSEGQRQAVLAALSSRLFVLTGGPGTGKTTTVRTIVKLLKRLHQKVLLASPTGRAAKRLAEVTGEEAKTLHRLLEFTPEQMRFGRDADRPLEADVVLVDEASMLDTVLAHHLLKAVPPLGHLILVGDADQLPSVGPGNVLGDLLRSRRVPAVTLSQVFRQAERSLIVSNAHRIRRGEFPELLVPDGRQRADCYFVEANDPESACERVANIVGKSLPARFGLHPIDDIQVLSPMNRGTAGASHLNSVLQAALNPPRPDAASVAVGRGVFRVGDKVIQARNNYDKQVFNGDMGRIAAIDLEARNVVVSTPEAEIDYEFSELDELGLAYAISTHKSQGSEFPAVVLVLLPQHYPLLQRNLLYTALTRAKQVVVIVGAKRAIARAVANAEVSRRFTGLAERLDHLPRLEGGR